MDMKAAPPSPAPSHHEGLPSGFDQIVQFNAEQAAAAHAEIQQHQMVENNFVQAGSHPVSRYGTPVPAQQQYFETPAMHQYQDPNQYAYPDPASMSYPMDGLPNAMVSTITTFVTTSTVVDPFFDPYPVSHLQPALSWMERGGNGDCDLEAKWPTSPVAKKEAEPEAETLEREGEAASIAFSEIAKPYSPRPTGDDFEEWHTNHFAKDQSNPIYNTPSASPQGPSTILASYSRRQTRSGGASGGNKALGPQGGGVTKNVKASPRKKGKARVKAPSKVVDLDKPLTVIAKEYNQNVFDMEAYVHRSSEARHKERQGGKEPGKIKRPMNAFMLYRKTYQGTAKTWCEHNNHQVVSQVCGQSWPMEDESVRAQFTEWANIERANHMLAFPEYKFTPSKPKNKKGSTHRDSADPDAEYAQQVQMYQQKRGMRADDSPLPDYRWEGASATTSRTRTPFDDGSDTEYRPPRSVYQQYNRGGMAQRSTFSYTNPGKALPEAYNPSGLHHSQYYQTNVMAHGGGLPGHVEDLVVHKTQSPNMAYHHQQAMPQHPNNVALSYMQNAAAYSSPAPGSMVQQQMLLAQQAEYEQQQQGYLPELPQGADDLYATVDPALQAVGDVAGGSYAAGSAEAVEAGIVAPAVGGDAFVGYDAGLEEQHTEMLKGNPSDWNLEDGDTWLSQEV